EEFRALQLDVQGLYDNWFVETCDEWVVPYMGDLLGVKGVYGEDTRVPSHRAWVANTLRYRRRKGLASVLARAVQDATGWRTRAVEFFERLAATQHVRHPRPAHGGTVDLRRAARAERTDTPWDTFAHTVDVRTAGSGGGSAPGGRYNLGQVGLFLWRLGAYPAEGASARRVGEGRYTFHPFGIDTPLFNPPETETDVTREPGERNVPDVLDRTRLEEEAQRMADHPRYLSPYFASAPVLEVRIDGDPVPPASLAFMDLSEWAAPPASRPGSPDAVPILAAVDPATGRLALPPGAEAGSVAVSWSSGFSGDLGGGPYDRRAALQPVDPDVPVWTVGAAVPGIVPAPDFGTLDGALAAWERVRGRGVVRILDDRTYALPVTRGGFRVLGLGEDGHLTVEAVDGVFPTVAGSLELRGSSVNAHFHLGGVRLDGEVRLVGEVQLHVRDCTLRPRREEPAWRRSVQGRDAGPGMWVRIERCISGPLDLPPGISGVRVEDSIVDGAEGYAFASGTAPHDDAGPGPQLVVTRSTVFGLVFAAGLAGVESVFADPVIVQRDQEGSIQFSYVPPGSITPPRHRCQPDTALASAGSDAERERTLASLFPRFTSTRYGDAAYGQLSLQCPVEIRTGGRNGSEMGAFQSLQQPQREANLRAALDEYLPYGTQAGIFYVT
ncbi:MAG TPA: hypothetical protein VF263_09835, partial [Longimicrobiaceae bacterium]